MSLHLCIVKYKLNNTNYSIVIEGWFIKSGISKNKNIHKLIKIIARFINFFNRFI